MSTYSQTLVALLLFASGCSGGMNEAPVAPAPATTTDATPAASTPVAAPAPEARASVTGTHGGKPFASKSGLARRDAHDVTKRDFNIWIFETEAGCENLGDAAANSAISVQKLPADTRFLSARVAWEPGVTLEVHAYNAGLHSVDADGNELGGGASSGSVEVLKAPQTPGEKGMVKVSVRKGTESDLSGTVELLVCP